MLVPLEDLVEEDEREDDPVVDPDRLLVDEPLEELLPLVEPDPVEFLLEFELEFWLELDELLLFELEFEFWLELEFELPFELPVCEEEELLEDVEDPVPLLMEFPV